MNLQYLRYALEISRTGSISKAAENLSVAQPNLSRAVKELEATLGISIFERTRTGMTVTPEGEKLLSAGERILRQVGELETMFDEESQPRESLSVCAAPAAYLFHAFVSFCAALPEDGLYETRFAEADLAELKSLFPELAMLKSITMLDDPLRYGALRDLGLSPSEAYLATCKRRRYDNRSHLTGLVPRSAAGSVYGMSASELESARELFGSLSDSEIQKLYKKVTR